MSRQPTYWTNIFAVKLVQYRRSNGLTQADLAKKLGVNVKSVSRLENGYQLPRLDHAIIIANRLGFSLGEIQERGKS